MVPSVTWWGKVRALVEKYLDRWKILVKIQVDEKYSETWNIFRRKTLRHTETI